MPRSKGQTSQQRGDQDNDKDTTIHRLAELVERQAQQIERLIEHSVDQYIHISQNKR